MKHALIRRPAGVILLALASLLLCSPGSRAQIPTNVFLRVVLLKVGDISGTAFTIDVDGRQYLITAKHVAAKLRDGDSVRIHRVDGWMTSKVTVLRCEDPVDIAVLIPDRQITIDFPLEPGMTGMQLGQDVYFLGFPYGWLLSDVQYTSVNGQVSIAFIKKAVASSSAPAGRGSALYLDGHNNPGFSGGPIVFRDFSRQGYVMKVAGVVSGYQPDLQPVLTRKKILPTEDLSGVEPWRIITIDGQKYRLEDTQQLVDTNSGIVKAYEITPAVELIRKHPDGPKVTDGMPPLE